MIAHPVLVRSVLRNNLGEEGAKAIVQAAQTKPQLMTLCGIKPDQTEASFFRQGLGVADAILLAFDLSRNSGLVKLECAPLWPSPSNECLHYRQQPLTSLLGPRVQARQQRALWH